MNWKVSLNPTLSKSCLVSLSDCREREGRKGERGRGREREREREEIISWCVVTVYELTMH